MREELSRSQAMIEFIYTGLRSSLGILFLDFEKRFQEPFISGPRGREIEGLIQGGFLENLKDRAGIRATSRGWRLLDEVVGRISAY